MGFRRKFKAKVDPQACDPDGRCCACPARCPHPGCTYPCLGSHDYKPDSHWCADEHWWTTRTDAMGAHRAR